MNNTPNISIKYSIKICKYIKHKAHQNKKLYIIIDLDEKHRKILRNLITNHNNLLQKFTNLYNKFMDLIEHIKQTSPHIFDTSDKIERFDIQRIRCTSTKKLQIEQFDTEIINYLSLEDRNLLENYIKQRELDLHDKITHLIRLIEKLENITTKFKKEILNL
jgi:hypothetical protein